MVIFNTVASTSDSWDCVPVVSGSIEIERLLRPSVAASSSASPWVGSCSTVTMGHYYHIRNEV